MRARALTRAVIAATTVVVLAAGCSGDDEPELTVEQRLAAIEGRELTPSEVDERLTVAATLCRLEDRILDRLWRKLDDDQLAFQDFVFSHQCPDRSILYAGHTGRYVTEEAEQSGVVTSTTRPATTTSSTARDSSATTGPATATTGASGGATVDSTSSSDKPLETLPLPGDIPTTTSRPGIGPTSTGQDLPTLPTRREP